MNSAAPNGFFAEGLMIYGSLGSGGIASKGFVFQTPDRRGAGIPQLNAAQDKIRNVLALLSPQMRAQFQWGNGGDYGPELAANYREIEEIADPEIRRVRLRYFRRHWKKLNRRALRREELVLFLSTQIASQPGRMLTREALRAHNEKLLGQLRTQFEEITDTLRMIFGADATVTPMDDLKHFTSDD